MQEKSKLSKNAQRIVEYEQIDIGWRNMNMQSSPGLITALQSTLRQLEQTEEMTPEDPALVELKRSIVRVMAELEVKKASMSEAGSDAPALSPA